ncbi:S-formylglutathione hydrolase FrmB [Nocardia transvalensis]|uniref:S-formylglutathione hydrolase FrmB n=1 Tax=Nocardia transvalensis TaxID=37333 RepID=A0A7W9PDQ6_9NOCA|nr:alpha/beta hydrolase family protein [Nocardia transvalensis]MBB5914165.1 S-formylglutathione hydrolase FrmB [Nocardia transvalensis]
MRRFASLVAAVAAFALSWIIAAPATPAAEARLVSENAGPGRLVDLTVHSPAMDRDVRLQVLRPDDTNTPAPTLYLLNGAGGGEDAATWLERTDAADFFADKHVNVVIPTEGAFSYYTDWQRPDAGLAKKLGNNGRNMWSTFLTRELPPLIDAAFGTTGRNAVAGISMAGTSVLDLAMESPDLYSSVAAYSGCAMTSDPLGAAAVTLVVGLGGGDAKNMWGPNGGEGWREHDPYLHADRLPPIPMYISSGTGLPGRHDSLADPTVDYSTRMLANQVLLGGGIESAANYCTTKLAERTRELGRTDITYAFHPTGTHSWGYWQEDLHRSWPMMAASMGL